MSARRVLDVCSASHMSVSDPRSPVLTGGCQCGAVRYALFATPKTTLCHCRMCQKAVGGPFASLAMVDLADLVWTRGAPAHFQSSSMARRGFCAACGTPLSYEGASEGRIEITTGSLDVPEAAIPVEQFGIERRMPWLSDLAAMPSTVTDQRFDGLTSYQHPDHDT